MPPSQFGPQQRTKHPVHQRASGLSAPPRLKARLAAAQQHNDAKRKQHGRAKQEGGSSKLWDEAKHPRTAGGQFGQSHTSQSQARDRAVRQAQARGDKPAARAAQSKYVEQWRAFLKKLPMAQEGADLKIVAAFVRKARTMSDEELEAEKEKIRAEHGDDDMAAVATIDALLENRKRVREENKRKHPLPKHRGKKQSPDQVF